jgi:hypothetical protein
MSPRAKPAPLAKAAALGLIGASVLLGCSPRATTPRDTTAAVAHAPGQAHSVPTDEGSDLAQPAPDPVIETDPAVLADIYAHNVAMIESLRFSWPAGDAIVTDNLNRSALSQFVVSARRFAESDLQGVWLKDPAVLDAQISEALSRLGGEPILHSTDLLRMEVARVADDWMNAKRAYLKTPDRELLEAIATGGRKLLAVAYTIDVFGNPRALEEVGRVTRLAEAKLKLSSKP